MQKSFPKDSDLLFPSGEEYILLVDKARCIRVVIWIMMLFGFLICFNHITQPLAHSYSLENKPEFC